VVLDGMERAFEKRGEAKRPVRSLAYLVGAVDDAAKLWRERQVGRPTASVGGLAPAFEALVTALESAGRRDPRLAAACAETARAVRTLAERALAGTEPDPAGTLLALDEALAERALATLDASHRNRLEADVDAALTLRSDDPARIEARRARLHEAARAALALPALVLDLGGERW
jgi:hypothetical protein